MANILDYLQWRGDIPFYADPFNEIDALILSQFGYVPLDGIVPADFSRAISVENAYKYFTPEKIPEAVRFISFEQDNLLFRYMAESERFKNILLTGYVNMIDTAEEVQFSAVTCTIGDGTRFISFRGTDGSVVGWKEDFSIAYLQQTTGQLYSVGYINENFSQSSPPLRIGGHSKGGNLAIYASAFADTRVRSRIMEVYSFDGPGFREEITDSSEYADVSEKVRSFVPESSVVGMLLNNSLPHKIVKSSVNGIMQHLAYNWELLRNRFVCTNELSKSGDLINKTITGWLDNFSDEERKVFTDTLFAVLEAPEKDTLKEILKGKWSAYSSMFKALRTLSPEQQNVLKDAVKKIAKSGKNAIMPDKEKTPALTMKNAES